MTKFLGIDVGGNHVKAALVSTAGEISAFESFDTAGMLQGKGFVENFCDVVAHCLKLDKSVASVGIGLPGTLDKTRKIPMEVPSIPELCGVRFHEILSARFPGIAFHIENDANAATLGEYKFSPDPLPSSFVMITMGTGIGGGAVVDGKIFNGGDGNAFEPGDMPSRGGNFLEVNIGKAGINEMLVAALGVDLEMTEQPKDSIIAAKSGAVGPQKVLFEVGQILGESLLSVIRIVDIKTILIGGGISAAFEFIAPGVMDVLNAGLTPYFKQGLSLRRASLGNDAGVLGAASLCF